MKNIQKDQPNTEGLTVAVVGSRSVQGGPTAERLAHYLTHLQPALVVSGGAAGADRLAAEWARANGVPLLELRPDYAAHGAGATHRRNRAIVERADLVVLLWDGHSTGTLSTARAAARLGRRCEWLLHGPPSAAPVAGGLGL
jgi:predicted Rossmann fold nucleotide-binding protein DprA/Smf involved in DNA uptake